MLRCKLTLNLSELSAAECGPVTTVCMLLALKRSAQAEISVLLLCMKTKKYLPFLITYMPIYTTLASACLSFVPEPSPASSLRLHAKIIKSIKH